MSQLEKLKKNTEFTKTYTKGKYIATKLVVIYYIPNNTPLIRVGFSASKKVGNSVVRNRARRLMKETFRLNVPAISGYDLVFVARSAITESSYKEVEKTMRYLFRKLTTANDQKDR